MKYASGEEPAAGDKIRSGSSGNVGTVTELREGLMYVSVVGEDSKRDGYSVKEAVLLSRASSPPVAPSATPGEERFASGAYWESTDLKYAHAAIVSDTDYWAIHWGFGVAIGAENRLRQRHTNDGFKAQCAIYRGNIATAAADFLIALTRAADVATYAATGREPYPGAFRANSDTLPSPAPTGSFIAGGREYDEIPSRYGEADEDAVFKRQVRLHADLRAQEEATRGNFERVEKLLHKFSLANAPGVSLLTDRVSGSRVLAEIRIGGEREELLISNTASAATIGMLVGEVLGRIRGRIGARAMRGAR